MFLLDEIKAQGASYKLHQFCMTGVGAVAMKVNILFVCKVASHSDQGLIS